MNGEFSAGLAGPGYTKNRSPESRISVNGPRFVALQHQTLNENDVEEAR
jgi:hypothetical protein